jgi:hypothetical protein
MTTFTANFPAGLPLIASLIASIRAIAATPAAADSSVWSLYRLAGADSVSPAVAAALAARARD